MGRGKARRTLELLDAAHRILSEIQPASVRAVCYRLFTIGLIENMSKRSTNRVSTQLTWAREQGLIPWEWVVDDTRPTMRVRAWDNPGQYVEHVKRSYRRDRWNDQPIWLELWSEKGTVLGTLDPVIREYGFAFRNMRGFGSATVVHRAAIDSLHREKPTVVLYVGDWDPSGLSMSEVDLPSRIAEYGGNITLERLALTKADTESGLPSFDADSKVGDARYRWYRNRFGPRCWELDALSPVLLRNRVEEAVRERLDFYAWALSERAESAELASLSTILSGWPGISGQASKYSSGPRS